MNFPAGFNRGSAKYPRAMIESTDLKLKLIYFRATN